MPSPTAFTSPTVATNDASIGTTAWFINTTYDDDGSSLITCTCPVDKTTSNYLEMTGYGFSLPVASALAGIEVALSLTLSGGTNATLYAQLLKNGNLAGVQKSLYPATYTTFGSNIDKWSATWSQAELSASNFGVAIWVVGGSNGIDVSLTGATIRLYYAEGASSPGSSTSGHFLFTWII